MSSSHLAWSHFILRLRGLSQCLLTVSRLNLALSCLLLSSACTKRPLINPSTDFQDTRHQYEELIRKTRAEDAALRTELSSLRIATAKKEAEMIDLKRQLTELRQARTEHQQALDAKHLELSKTKTERDQLVQVKQDMQIQLAEVPQLRQSAIDANTVTQHLQGRLQTLEAALATVTTDLTQMRTDLAQTKADLLHSHSLVPIPSKASTRSARAKDAGPARDSKLSKGEPTPASIGMH